MIQIQNCGLTKIGDLSFNFFNGACSSRLDKEIYLCFENDGDNKNCRRSTGALEAFVSIASSKYGHDYTRLASSPGKG